MSADAISKALNDFGRMPLREGAVRLLGEFGLKGGTPLKGRFDGTPENFLRGRLIKRKLTSRQRYTFCDLIREIFFIFQIRATDVNLRPSPAKCEGACAPYILFVAADMQNSRDVNQESLDRIIRIVNREFAQPVVGLFRYEGQLALGAASRRAHKQHRHNPESDVLIRSGVTTGISLCKPSWEHLAFLRKWKRIITSGPPTTLGDVVRHLASVSNDSKMRHFLKYTTGHFR